MKAIWNWFNQKKTGIGAACFLVALIVENMVDIWAGNHPPDWTPKLVETLQWLGGVFSGVGLSHKGVKSLSSGKVIKE